MHEPGFTGAQRAADEAASVMVVGNAVWAKIAPAEQRRIQALKTVKVLDDTEYGVIADTQSADQSTAATYGGAAIGSGASQALYIGRAINGGSYSPAMQLAVGVLGGIAGSTLDSQAVEKHTHRYTVRLGNGEIQYMDETKRSQFRHSVGVCVTVPDMEQLSQKVCFESPEELVARTLKDSSAKVK